MAAVTTVMLLLLRLLSVLGLFGPILSIDKIMDPCEQEPGGLRPWVPPCDVLSV